MKTLKQVFLFLSYIDMDLLVSARNMNFLCFNAKVKLLSREKNQGKEEKIF